MKWFKHSNDLLSGPNVQICLDKFGPIGPYAWVRLLEVLAEHLDVEKPDTFIESFRDIQTKCFPGCYKKKIISILDFFQAVGWITYKIYGNEILFNCKIIKNLADEYTRKVLAEKSKKEPK